MKFLVISDTHGRVDKALDLCRKHTDTDAVIHLGDYEKDAREIENFLGSDIISVKGNMDNGYSKNEYKILETECGRLLLTHGHMQHVKSSLQSLLYFAEENGCIAALFGHTHMPVCDEADGIHLINPGSLTLPADGSQGSYAVINTDGGIFDAQIFYYNPNEFACEAASECSETAVCEKEAKSNKSKPKVQGGFIRSLLNNSDRF